MTSHLPVALVLAIVASTLQGTFAHGGGLHRWTFDDDVRENVPTAVVRYDAHVKIGSCSNWQYVDPSFIYRNYPLPYFKADVNMTVEGSIDLYSYLGGGNCTNSPQSGLFPNLKFTTWKKGKGKWTGKAPKTDASTFGYAFDGPCMAPGNHYRNNITLQDNRFNLLFWNKADGYIGRGMNASDLYPGRMWGATVNAWFPRVKEGETRIQSIFIITEAALPMCCEVDYEGFAAPEDVLELGKHCDDSDGGHD